MAKASVKPIQKVVKPLTKLIKVIGWIVGVLVALAVGFGMKEGILTVPYLEPIVPLAGWIVIILTIVGVIMEVIDALS